MRYLTLVVILCLALPACAKPNFDDVAGWGDLRWGMDLDEAREALNKARVPFQERSMPKDGTAHLLLRREPWDGTIYFDHRGRLESVLFQSPTVPRAEEAEQFVQTPARQRFGPPHDTQLVPCADQSREETLHLWQNATTRLEVRVVHSLRSDDWIVWEEYTPMKTLEDPDEGREIEDDPNWQAPNPPPRLFPVECATLEELRAHDGEMVSLRGVYQTQDMAPYKMAETLPSGQVVTSSKIAVIRLKDGTVVDLGVRPVLEMDLTPGAAVLATGKLLASPQRQPEHVAQPDRRPVLTQIESILETSKLP